MLGETLIFSTAVLVMLIGLIGVILPVMPGLILVWLGVLAYAIVEGFSRIDPISFTVITLLAAIGVTADIWMTQLGARMGGASFRSILWGLAGGILGAGALLVLGGLSAGFGALLGSVAGVLVAEYSRVKDWPTAIKAAAGWMVGWLASTLFQFSIAAAMIVVFIWQVYKG